MILDIAKGWTKMLLNTELSEAEKERVKICGSCEYVKVVSLLCHDFNTCGACGCTILAKIRVPEQKCPKGKWGKIK